ncbi:hypothetical protein ABID97_002707 [Variovorax sp. OAS795]|uniref:hypothetical protein n=1 Tax=Variovorax sp. OAS795 TaxID=3034231 RepID=UPI003396B3A4
MDDHASKRIFVKTQAGRAALAERSTAGRARTALILVNGQDTMQALRAKLGPDADVLIRELRQRGLVDLLRPAIQAPEPQPVPAPSVPPMDESDRLEPLKREAIARLGPHFGPDAPIIAAALTAATQAAAYNAALGTIEARLALYLGKAGAAQVLAGLRG